MKNCFKLLLLLGIVFLFGCDVPTPGDTGNNDRYASLIKPDEIAGTFKKREFWKGVIDNEPVFIWYDKYDFHELPKLLEGKITYLNKHISRRMFGADMGVNPDKAYQFIILDDSARTEGSISIGFVNKDGITGLSGYTDALARKTTDVQLQKFDTSINDKDIDLTPSKFAGLYQYDHQNFNKIGLLNVTENDDNTINLEFFLYGDETDSLKINHAQKLKMINIPFTNTSFPARNTFEFSFKNGNDSCIYYIRFINDMAMVLTKYADGNKGCKLSGGKTISEMYFRQPD